MAKKDNQQNIHNERLEEIRDLAVEDTVAPVEDMDEKELPEESIAEETLETLAESEREEVSESVEDREDMEEAFAEEEGFADEEEQLAEEVLETSEVIVEEATPSTEEIPESQEVLPAEDMLAHTVEAGEESGETVFSEENIEMEDITDGESSEIEERITEDGHLYEEEVSEAAEIASASMEDDLPPRSNGFRLMSFSRKLMLICLIPMIIVSVAIIYISSNALTNKIETQIEEALQIVTCSLEETYNSLYKGDYSKDKSGRLSKGDTQISGDTALLDALKEQTGYESSMIYGDMRLITTVKRKAGGRIQGTNVDKKVYQKVMKGKSVFRTDIIIQDIEYYAYYQPLFNSDGSVCGMVGSAKPAAEVQQMIQKAIKDVIRISVIIMIISMILILIVASHMANTMKKTKNYLAIIADGDLVSEADARLLKRKDELGDIYYMSVKLQHEFRKIVTNIKESVEHLSESADGLTEMAQGTRLTVDEVFDSVEVISQGANTQAQHTSTAAENVSKIGEQIEYIASEVDSLTKEASKMAEAEKASEVIIHKLNISNEETIDSITNVAEQINVTNTSIKRIRRAATMIQSISEETDLLSLNASIEAARAGEAGKGFAVVAEQICKLADQSNSAAEQIEEIIKKVTEESSKMVEIMEIVKDNVDDQQKKLSETKDKFNSVAIGVETSRANIEGIRQKMDVLGKSSDAIMGVVENLADISEKNADSTEDTMASARDMTATMEELETASEKLRELSARLDKSLEIFKM